MLLMDPSHVTTNNHVVIGRDTEAHGAMLATAIQPRRGDGRPQRATAIQGEQQRRAPLERHAAFTTLPFAPPTGRPGTPCVEADTPFHPQLTGGASVPASACQPISLGDRLAKAAAGAVPHSRRQRVRSHSTSTPTPLTTGTPTPTTAHRPSQANTAADAAERRAAQPSAARQPEGEEAEVTLVTPPTQMPTALALHMHLQCPMHLPTCIQVCVDKTGLTRRVRTAAGTEWCFTEQSEPVCSLYKA